MASTDVGFLALIVRDLVRLLEQAIDKPDFRKQVQNIEDRLHGLMMLIAKRIDHD